MSIAIFSLIFLPLSLWFATLAADRTGNIYVMKIVLWSWLIFMPLLAAMNAWMPFAGGGDDERYFELADPPIKSLSDALDLTRFASFIEQPGYPWLLSLTNALTGHDILVYKGLNFFFLVLLSLVWYRIGMALEGPFFARRIMVVILLVTPLWNYVFFLLKDLSICLLQSLFLFAAIQIWSKVRIRPILIGILSTFLILLFRTPLVVQNAAVLLGGLTLKFFGRTSLSGLVLPLIIILFVGALKPVVSNTEIMAKMGILSENRVLSSAEFLKAGQRLGEEGSMNRSLFPLIYLFSETAGFNPVVWNKIDSFWLRGILALPWIFCIVPFFIIGILRMFEPKTGTNRPARLFARLRYSRVVCTPWSMVILFVLISIIISWSVADTTRWRISDMPMVAAIALAGWKFTRPRNRKKILLVWIAGSGTIFFLYYFFKV